MADHITVMSEGTQEVLEFAWGRIVWLCNSQIAPEAEMTFGVVTIEAGQTNPVHSHPNCEELLYVISGQCRHSLDDEWVDLGPGDLIRCPAHARHNAINTGSEPVKCVIAYSSPDRQMEVHEGA
ncbi:MAG: cupin domain-containing protein [Armatimonadota bacterium]